MTIRVGRHDPEKLEHNLQSLDRILDAVPEHVRAHRLAGLLTVPHRHLDRLGGAMGAGGIIGIVIAVIVVVVIDRVHRVVQPIPDRRRT